MNTKPKKAEEWRKILLGVELSNLLMLDVAIKQVQLDAYRAGMMRSVSFMQHFPTSNITDCSAELNEVATNLTEKDLE